MVALTNGLKLVDGREADRSVTDHAYFIGVTACGKKD